MKLTDKERTLVNRAKAGHQIDPAVLSEIIDRLTAEPLREDTCPPRRCDSAGTGVGVSSLPPVGPALPDEIAEIEERLTVRTNSFRSEEPYADVANALYEADEDVATLLRHIKSQPARVVDRERLAKWFRSRVSPPFATPESLVQEGFLERFNARADKKSVEDAAALLSSGIFVKVSSEEEIEDVLSEWFTPGKEAARAIIKHIKGEKK